MTEKETITETEATINLKEWSPTKFPEQICDKQKKRLYEKFGFDETELDSLSQELVEIKRDLKQLKK